MIDPPPMTSLDAHCHLLPGIDDGPKSMVGSVKMAQLLTEMGVQTVVATPHVISDVYPNTVDIIEEKTREVQAELNQQSIPLKVIPGAEYYIEPAFQENIEKGNIICFGTERYVLFESPVENKPLLLESIVFSLKSAGYTPLLAHAERYRFLQNNKDEYQHLKKLGVHFQVNHPSYHLPQTSTRGETARWLHVKGLVDLLGTDLHRATPWIHAHPKPKRRFWSLRSQS